MNIFRIIASGKHKFREEFVSAFLAYLLSPKMDHGLGSTFLSMLLNGIAQKNGISEIKNLEMQIEGKFRDDIFQATARHPLVEIEFPYPRENCGKGFIDIVLRCDNWFIMIENKIIADSMTKEQIKEQYEGLRCVLKNQGLSDVRVLAIYLVPAIGNTEEWRLSQDFLDEINFSLADGDFASLVSWQPTKDEDGLSIVGIVRDLLAKESQGIVPPIGYEVRHSLLCLIDFALGQFRGFPYDRTAVDSPAPDTKRVSDVLNLSGDIYIGIQYGIAGIINRGWMNTDFVNETVNITEEANRGWQYLPLRDFQIVAKWAMNPDHESLNGVNWKGKPFGTKNLYRVAKSVGSGIYIGLRGGLEALKSMDSETLAGRNVWEIGTVKKTNQWFSGDEFCQVVESKEIKFL